MARIQLLVFSIGKREFAINAESTSGILRNKKFPMQKMPGSDCSIDGMINLRGKIVYLFNLYQKLSIQKNEFNSDAKIVLINTGKSNTGFIVDEVNDIIRFNTDEIEPPPFFISGEDARYISGVAKIEDRLVVILDLEKLLSGKDLSVIAQPKNEPA